MKHISKFFLMSMGIASAIAVNWGAAMAQQSGSDQPRSDQPADADGNAGAKTVSLGEVLQVAVRQDPALQKAAIDVDIAEAAVVESSGVHDWVLDASGSWVKSRSQGIDGSLGVPVKSEVDTYNISADISRFFGIGGTLSLHADAGYRDLSTEVEGLGENNSQSYSTNVSATYNQALLRGRGEDNARAAQMKAAINRDATWLAQRSQATTTVRLVVDGYWDLALALRELEISQNSLNLAQERLRNTRAAISAGSVAATEALAVEQTIALRQEEVLLAELAIAQRSLDLRRRSGLEIGPGEIELSTSTPLALTPKSFRIDALLTRAYARSPQIAQLETLQKGAQIEVEVTENGLLPQLDLAVSAGSGGSDESASETLSQTATLDNPTISATLTLRHAFGNRAANGAHRRARSDLFRQKVDLADVKAQIASSLVLAVKQARVAEQRVALSQRAIELADKNIEAEKARFELGRATNFDVLQRQDELKQAQVRKARATVDYLRAVAAIDAITGDILTKYGIKLDAE
ncbi:MAG: TolC family protein [Proteobacteria bacterium]|nr:TolC family protein [Pseudomonadota bacterium]